MAVLAVIGYAVILLEILEFAHNGLCYIGWSVYIGWVTYACAIRIEMREKYQINGMYNKHSMQ